MAETSIQWTDHSVNPIRARDPKTGKVGHYCEMVSPGCAKCYASAMQPRRFGLPAFTAGSHRQEVEPFLDEGKLAEVLRRRKPTKYFWCDMTDLFGEWVPDGWIDKCFATMALTPQHTHQVLTKRADRMRDYVLGADGREINFEVPGLPLDREPFDWPLPNVWLGVSVEDQARADERIPHLLQTPAAVRFLSCEPLLGPVDLMKLYQHPAKAWASSRALSGTLAGGQRHHGVDWCIIGGESGSGARPMDLDWARALVGQCRAAGVPAFVKQLGARPRERVDVPAGKSVLGAGVNSMTLSHAGIVHEREGWLRDPKGGSPEEWPEDLRVRQFPGGTANA